MDISDLIAIRFRITQMKFPTVRSRGTRYFFLSITGSEWQRADRSQITGTRSGYFASTRVASKRRADNDFCSVSDESVSVVGGSGIAAQLVCFKEQQVFWHTYVRCQDGMLYCERTCMYTELRMRVVVCSVACDVCLI